MQKMWYTMQNCGIYQEKMWDPTQRCSIPEKYLVYYTKMWYQEIFCLIYFLMIQLNALLVLARENPNPYTLVEYV